ncbi:uncharacterized protein [Panulirus ornatus]|uniref:uncharacterized protein isoform X2 n=1 Tax=Panulirus ornatus TaxID=150431 RepID=UPI003A8ACF15
MANACRFLLLLLGFVVTSSGASRAAAIQVIQEPIPVQGDGDERRPGEPHPSPDLGTRRAHPPSPGRGQEGPLSPPFLEPNRRKAATLQPQRNSATSRGQTHPQEDGGGGGGVDDVLAALVSYSRDPALWRFVHSVVEELDYSQHASTRVPGRRHHLPTLHVSRTHGHWWRATPEQSETTTKWHDGSHSNKSLSDGGDESGGGSSRSSGVEDRVGVVGSTAQPHPPQTPFLPDERGEVGDAAQQRRRDYFTGNTSLPPSAHPDDSPSTRLPHFLFHKVYIDTTYDSHTRQPYHRPVLAVTAVTNGKGKAADDTKDDDDEETDSISTVTYQLDSEGLREFPDKLEEILSVTEKDLDELSGEDVGSVKENEGESQEDDDLSEMWRKMQHRNSRHHRASYKARKLHTFKSQMKFLQRWEERLWRHSQHRTAQHPTHTQT